MKMTVMVILEVLNQNTKYVWGRYQSSKTSQQKMNCIVDFKINLWKAAPTPIFPYYFYLNLSFQILF